MGLATTRRLFVFLILPAGTAFVSWLLYRRRRRGFLTRSLHLDSSVSCVEDSENSNSIDVPDSKDSSRSEKQHLDVDNACSSEQLSTENDMAKKKVVKCKSKNAPVNRQVKLVPGSRVIKDADSTSEGNQLDIASVSDVSSLDFDINCSHPTSTDKSCADDSSMNTSFEEGALLPDTDQKYDGYDRPSDVTSTEAKIFHSQPADIDMPDNLILKNNSDTCAAPCLTNGVCQVYLCCQDATSSSPSDYHSHNYSEQQPILSVINTSDLHSPTSLTESDDSSVHCVQQHVSVFFEPLNVNVPSLQEQQQHMQEHEPIPQCLSETGSSSSDSLQLCSNENNTNSLFSDTQSEGSSDSGKPASDAFISYHFEIPQKFVGRLIGRNGVFVQQIKFISNASVFVKVHPNRNNMKLVAVEGTTSEVVHALELIRNQFPTSRYSFISLKQVEAFSQPVTRVAFSPECLQLPLVMGVRSDVIMCAIVNGGHLFIQQPTHPSYTALSRLKYFMQACYSDCSAPSIPLPIQCGIACVAPYEDGWVRVQIIGLSQQNDHPQSKPGSDAAAADETSTCPEVQSRDLMVDVKLLDLGGYMTYNVSQLKQIRADFMMLPFQSTECFLAFVTPIDEGLGWSEEAAALLARLTEGQLLQVEIVGFSEESIPLVVLFSVEGGQQININEEMVSRGFAKWVTPVVY